MSDLPSRNMRSEKQEARSEKAGSDGHGLNDERRGERRGREKREISSAASLSDS